MIDQRVFECGTCVSAGAREAVEVEKRVEQAVLDDGLRVLLIPGNPKGEVVHVSAMALDERQKHLYIGGIHHGCQLIEMFLGTLVD